MAEAHPPFPGDTATAAGVRKLAEEYRLAAAALEGCGRRGQPLSYAPYRLVAIHAIELYLNAFLMRTGHSAAFVRGLQHDLATRAEQAAAAGLALRRRTISHLRALNGRREYLVSRYSADGTEPASELNRLASTLNEISRKT